MGSFREFLYRCITNQENRFPPYMEQEIRNLSDFSRIYCNMEAVLEQDAVTDTRKMQYGTSVPLYRGFYNPSLIDGQIIANCKRGRLYQSAPASGNYFCYHLDENDRLIAVKQYHRHALSSSEYLVRCDQSEYGLMFQNATLIHATKCVYEKEKLLCFVRLHLPLELHMNSFSYESYRYENDCLTFAEVVLNGIYPHIFDIRHYAINPSDGTVSPK